MKNTPITFLGAVTVLSVAACTTAPRSLPPGEYTRTEKTVNEQGTETKKETTTNIYYDQYGNKRVTQETEMSQDPKGLLNKSTSKSVTTY